MLNFSYYWGLAGIRDNGLVKPRLIFARSSFVSEHITAKLSTTITPSCSLSALRSSTSRHVAIPQNLEEKILS
ncbi:hypothetical protein E2C01_097008 [Portunus trituberculatus]|uniref:Uncharacterized protein n=1 Tax=Portunus trituberculatus TaxID=210409 RepID=A0A5B7K3H0_PORTR|nr:hypothetical protein [Portunus trituberculatus]